MTLTARGTALALVALVALAFILSALTGGMRDPAAPREKSAPHIEEDDPRWDCATMGNRICGQP